MEEYLELLRHLLSHSENEVVEFKKAENSFDIDDLILNLVGAMIGFMLYKTKLLRWLEKWL